MRKSIVVAILASILLTGVHIAFAGEDDARTLINKSIDAIGGEKAAIKHNAVTFTDKGTYYGMGEGLPYSGKYAIQMPGQLRMEIEGVFIIVLDGDKGWVSAGGEVKAMEKEALATQIHDHKAGYMASLLPLRDKAFTLKMLKDATVGKKEASVVEASRKDWPTVKLFFDKKSSYLIKIEFQSKAAEQGFKDVTTDHVFSNFKDVDGLKVAHKVVMNRDGKVFVESEVTAMKAEGKLDAKVFAKPD